MEFGNFDKKMIPIALRYATGIFSSPLKLRTCPSLNRCSTYSSPVIQ